LKILTTNLVGYLCMITYGPSPNCHR